MTQLIYRRLVLLSGAHADIQPLARGWETVISGYVGRNRLQIGEYYELRSQARDRRAQINQEKKALVVSVEEILYPLGFIIAKFNKGSAPMPLPNQPPPNRLLRPYSHVKDIYNIKNHQYHY